VTPPDPPSRKGRLLVASPALADPHFRRSVVLILEHDDGGALGVILNRRTPVPARDALPDGLAEALPEDEVVHEGGPVQPESVILLAELTEPAEGVEVSFGSVGIVGPTADGAALEGSVRAIRAFGGYAGWGAGQLEQEIEEEAWLDAACLPSDVFTLDPEGLWSEVLERMGGRYRLVARMPEDPSLN
jgi:putative transcriptional regulator